MNHVLELDNLSKDYRSDWTFRATRVLHSLSLEIASGECFGLLGPNGAGKTTTFKLIFGFLRPTEGEIRFEGKAINTAERAAIGFLPEHPYFYDYLTVSETLKLFADLYGIQRSNRQRSVDEVIEKVGLEHKRRAALRSLSKGTLQRVGIAQAVLNHPRLLVLDEPMSGLDPIGRRQMRELIHDIRSDGTSVIFSSHILTDAEALCDRVAILKAGRLQEVIKIADHSSTDRYEIRISTPTEALRAAIAVLPDVSIVDHEESATTFLHVKSGVDQVVDQIRAHGVSILGLTPKSTSLEERFLSHVGNDRVPD